jgi:hypothetical protein
MGPFRDSSRMAVMSMSAYPIIMYSCSRSTLGENACDYDASMVGRHRRDWHSYQHLLQLGMLFRICCIDDMFGSVPTFFSQRFTL